MRKIIVRMLEEDGTVYNENTYTPEDLGIMGDDWDETYVDEALNILKENMPSAFTASGKYDFEIIEE